MALVPNEVTLRSSGNARALSEGGVRIPSTPTFKRASKRSSGHTDCVKRRIKRNRNYRSFQDFDSVSKYVARLPKCLLCGKEAKIVEHCHYSGLFRGHTCAGCNAKERESTRKARQQLGVSREEFERGEVKLTWSFWSVYGKELSRRLPHLTPKECRFFGSGRMWREKISPFFST